VRFGCFSIYAQLKKLFCFQHRLCNLVQEFNGLVSDEGRILPALSIFRYFLLPTAPWAFPGNQHSLNTFARLPNAAYIQIGDLKNSCHEQSEKGVFLQRMRI
jgi:hypothetical protein